MINELLVSFKDNIKSKTTNPFFGTLIIVWIIHNWRLVYTFFNFPAGTSLNARIQFLGTYLDPFIFLEDLGICVLTAFAVLLVTYFLLNLSRLIVNYSEKVVTPFVYKITDRGSVVLKSDYQKMVEERNRFEKKYELEHESRLKLITEMEKLELKLSDQSIVKPKEQNPNNEVILNNSTIDHLLNLVNNNVLKNTFVQIVIDILNNRSSKTTKNSDKLLFYGLIEKKSDGYQGYTYYTLTEKGQQLKDYLVSQNPNLLDEINKS